MAEQNTNKAIEHYEEWKIEQRCHLIGRRPKYKCLLVLITEEMETVPLIPFCYTANVFEPLKRSVMGATAGE